jgi:mono/diheme cytochrome c family protein
MFRNTTLTKGLFVTEIPEHLLKRSRDRRGGDSGESTPAASTPATTSAPAAPAAKAAAAPKVVAAKPDPAYVAAAKSRKKIPFWAMATLSLLPLWAFLYFLAIKPQEKTVEGPLAMGETVYAGCSSCHGAEGAGGAGRVLYQGEVLKTFPKIEDMLNFVYTGSQAFANAGLPIYGNPEREGGAHAPLSYNGGPMPAQGAEAGGGLTDAEILAVVCHERYTVSGADPVSEEWATEFETWCSPESPIYLALESGSSSFASIAEDFSMLENAPGEVGTAPRPSIG